MPKIAISYRREDSIDITGRIFDRLAGHYGRASVFRDIDNIPPGIDFRKHIDKALQETDVLIVVIGPRWLVNSAGHARIADEADPVRLEVEAALRRDIPVIPVLVGHATMPRTTDLPESLRDFAFRNAVQVDSGKDFDHHLTGLIRAMDNLFEPSQPAPQAPPPVRPAARPAPQPAVRPTASAHARDVAAATGAGGNRHFKIIAVRAIGCLLIVQAIMRAAMTYSFLGDSTISAYLVADRLNAAELVVLCVVAVGVGLATVWHRGWARVGGLLVCAYGLFNEAYFAWSGIGDWSITLKAFFAFNVALFVLGLIVYAFLWAPAEKRHAR